MSKRRTVLPGHMKKAIARVEELAATVDLAMEVVDARAPEASRCPILSRILTGCHHVKILSKTDLADARATALWKKHFEQQGLLWADLPYGRSIRAGDFLSRLQIPGYGQEGRMLKALIIGIPNVGKSTFTNLLVGRRRAGVGARPGITRGMQLVKIHKNVFMYDSPGVINPVIKNEEQGHILGLIGCLQENLFDVEAAAFYLADTVLGGHARIIEKTYGLELEACADAEGLIHAVAMRRGFLRKGGVPDLERAARLLVTDHAAGRLSGLSLELPPDSQ